MLGALQVTHLGARRSPRSSQALNEAGAPLRADRQSGNSAAGHPRRAHYHARCLICSSPAITGGPAMRLPGPTRRRGPTELSGTTNVHQSIDGTTRLSAAWGPSSASNALTQRARMYMG